MRLRHGREKMLHDRIDAPLASPFDADVGLANAFADPFDPLRLEQKVIVDEVARAVAVLPQVLELCDYVLGAARAPLALVEDRDVAERARPRAAARGLHRR